MKLNYKRTILVGFAFFLICAFWQIYDVTIAMTLTSKFGLSQTASGVVMGLSRGLTLAQAVEAGTALASATIQTEESCAAPDAQFWDRFTI